jgi:hypothetical protein
MQRLEMSDILSEFTAQEHVMLQRSKRLVRAVTVRRGLRLLAHA